MMKTIAVVLALVLPSTACLSSAQKSAVSATAETCAKQDLDQVLAESGESLLSTVLAYLAAGPAGWESALVALGVKYGPDAVACAVQVAEAIFGAETANLGGGNGSATAAPVTSDGVDYTPALANAKGFLTRHPIALSK